MTEGNATKLRVESVESDGSPRDFFATSAAVVSPTLETDTLDLVQVAPGVYEQDLGEIEPGAYSVRVTQTRPGAAALGRTLGLVAPTAAEYRILGANEPFLAALRAATGGEAIEDVAQVWTHNLTRRAGSPTCGRCCSWSPCCCGRSTSPSGASRSAGGSWCSPWLGHRRRTPPEDRRATAGGRRRAPGRSRSGVFDKCAQRARAEPDSSASAAAATTATATPASSSAPTAAPSAAPPPPAPAGRAGAAGRHDTMSGCGTQSGAPASADAERWPCACPAGPPC